MCGSGPPVAARRTTQVSDFIFWLWLAVVVLIYCPLWVFLVVHAATSAYVFSRHKAEQICKKDLIQ
jgi:hypothetical protein